MLIVDKKDALDIVSGTLPVVRGGTGVTTSTGTGNNVLSTSPTLVTPNIGVATGTSFNSITGLSSVVGTTSGTAAVGTSTTVARADHVHPAQTTITGNAGTATKLQTARTIALTGDVTGSVSFDGTTNVSITATIADDSHNHVISSVDGLQTVLDGKVDDSQVLTNVPLGAVFTDTVYTHPSTHPASIITEDTTHRFVTDVEKATWNANAVVGTATTSVDGLMSSSDKSKLDGIATGANNYILPNASSTVLGGVKISATAQTVAANAVTATAAKTYAVQLDASGNAVVNVPWVDTDTNTIYTHPTSDGSLHVPATSTTNNGKVLMAGATAGVFAWSTLPNVTTTTAGYMLATDKVKLDGIAASANNYIHPTTHDASIITVTDTFNNSNGTTVQVVLDDLDAAIDVEKGRIDAILNASTADKDTFAEIVTLINSVDTTNDTAFSGYVTSNNARSITIETTLATKVDKVAGKQLSTEDYTTVEKSKLAGISASANNYTHPASGVGAGTYKSVTVDVNGHVTGGTNPTTVSGYGLTDVYTKTESNTSLALKVNNSEKGVANGLATLDGNGKVVLTQIPDSVLGQLEYMGTGDFTTMPTATQKGQYWIASTSGNGYAVGDWAVWNGTAFDKVDNTDAVATVAGRTGNVVLTKSDVGLGNVDNTSDASKPVSTAQQTALDLKANLASPTFTGTVTAPTFSGALSGNATSANSAGYALYQSASGGATCDDKFKQTPAHGTSFSECNGVADAPNYGWWMIYSIRHSNSNNYWGTQIAYGWEDNANAIYQRNIGAGTWSGWTRVDVSSANITDLANNAGFITSAGRAYSRRSDGGDLNFYWSGQGGQPNWLWGGNDGSNMYVYNPANFSVNYANSAGYATTAAVGTNNTQIATTAFVIANSNKITPFTAGTYPEVVSSTVASTSSQSYSKLKEVHVVNAGVVTVSFGLYNNTGSGTSSAIIYVNNVAVGTIRSTSSTTAVTYTENITIPAQAYVQIYAKTTGINFPASVNGIKILVATPMTSSVVL